jgi:DNA-binding NarL/FixJ family response regulator
MASPFYHHIVVQGDDWAHRFWKKARRFGMGKSLSASSSGTDNTNAVNQTAEGNKFPPRRHQMKLSERQKQMHEEVRKKKTGQRPHLDKES